MVWCLQYSRSYLDCMYRLRSSLSTLLEPNLAFDYQIKAGDPLLNSVTDVRLEN